MKVGIIIVCYNNELDIDIKECTKHLKEIKDVVFCFVNNNSQDNTYDALKEINTACKNVSVINISKKKSDTAAVRAGARFMTNQFNLKHLGFVPSNKIIKYGSLSVLIKEIRNNQFDISSINPYKENDKGVKLTFFQSLFPILEHLEKQLVNN
jgi:GT2 family glycosyltransferase